MKEIPEPSSGLVEDGEIVNVQKCARCGDDHLAVVFQKMQQPMVDEHWTMTHWAACPTNGDPILWGTTEDMASLYDGKH